MTERFEDEYFDHPDISPDDDDFFCSTCLKSYENCRCDDDFEEDDLF